MTIISVCVALLALVGCETTGLSTREAEKLTGVAHSEFSRIRNARLQRFTLDRMVSILGKLDEDVEVNVTFRIRSPVQDELPTRTRRRADAPRKMAT